MTEIKDDLNRKVLMKHLGNIQQIADIRRCVLNEGKSSGIKACDIKTGSGLEFTVLESKCLDISNVSYKGVNISFLAKPGLVSPEFSKGNEFVNCFPGGMLYTCGLSNVGSPCNDNGIEYGLHGRIANIPANEVSVRKEWVQDEYIMEISGQMREAALFGENLVLKRKISTKLGDKRVRITDEVENQGFEEQGLMLLYHFNIGYPILDTDARLLISVEKTVPKDNEAAAGLNKCFEFCSAIDGFKEQVFYHKPKVDKNNDSFAALINDKLGIGFYIKYKAENLPNLVQWKSMKSGDYVLGLEPSNCFVEGRVKEKINGSLKTIKPFEKIAYELEFGIIDGIEEIKSFEAMLKQI